MAIPKEICTDCRPLRSGVPFSRFSQICALANRKITTAAVSQWKLRVRRS